MLFRSGHIYAANEGSSSVVKLDPATGTWVELPLAAGDYANHGLTLDIDSNVYSINQSGTVTKIEALTGTATSFAAGDLVSPYGYSGDMTGLTSSCMMGTTDTWLGPLLQSNNPLTEWQVLSWTATEPAGTSVRVYYRVDGAAGVWIDAGTSPATLGVTGQTFEVKAKLSAINGATAPSLGTVTVTYAIP